MDLFEELEKLAGNASESTAATADEIARWQHLFSYNYDEAVDRIENHKSDFTRTRISDDQWSIIGLDLEAKGYDKLAYEHKLAFDKEQAGIKKPAISKPALTPRQARLVYIVKLEGPLSTAPEIQIAASLSSLPEVINGEGDEGDASFCRVNGSEKQAILDFLATHVSSTFNPTFIRIRQMASKDLSPISLAPTLGIESTLPHHRANSQHQIFEPTQDQYPVWYFFYGTLANPCILSELLGLNTEPVLYPASIKGGKLGTFGGGKYKALLDDAGQEERVEGFAFEVLNREVEDALRFYETEWYEVVRCGIEMIVGVERTERMGCTFRFVGEGLDGEIE